MWNPRWHGRANTKEICFSFISANDSHPHLSKDIPQDHPPHSGFGMLISWKVSLPATVTQTCRLSTREEEHGRLQMWRCAGPHVWFEASLGCAARPTSKSEAGEAFTCGVIGSELLVLLAFPSQVLWWQALTTLGEYTAAATTHVSGGFCRCWDSLGPIWSLTCYISRADLNPYPPAFRVFFS